MFDAKHFPDRRFSSLRLGPFYLAFCLLILGLASLAVAGEGGPEAEVNGPPPPTADLEISKTDGADLIIPGSAVSYSITLINNGPDSITSAVIVDELPPELSSPVFSPSLGNYDDTTGEWDDFVLTVGSVATLGVDVTVASPLGISVTNTATVSPGGGVIDPNSGNNSAEDIDFNSSLLVFRDGFESGNTSLWSQRQP